MINDSNDFQKILPVIVSILIIIAIAILRNYSRSFAAVAVVMPLNIPLGMWIIYSGAEDKQKALVEFNQALFLNILPLLGFMLVTWYGAKSGWALVPMILAGYITWGIGLAGVLAARHFLS